MNKVLLIALFFAIGHYSNAQVNVGNSTPAPILVTVWYTLPGPFPDGCSRETSGAALIPPSNSVLFNPPSGMEVLSVVVSGGLGIDTEIVPCGPCPHTPGALYWFDWSPDCSHVKIKLY